MEIDQSTDVQKSSQQTRLKSYYAELKRLEEDYNNSKNSANYQYADENVDEFDDGMDENQKRRLLDNSERLERTGNQITEAYRLVVETGEIGSNVLKNLSQQRETIQRGRNRLRETNADLGRSGRLLNIMKMRSIRDKFALYIIAFVFILVIILTFYFTVTKNH